MTIRFVVKKSVNKRKCASHESVRATVYIRLKDGAGIDMICRTSVLVNPLWWDARREMVNDFAKCPEQERSAINAELATLRSRLASRYVVDRIKGNVDRDWLRKRVSELENRSDGEKPLLVNAMQDFIEKRSMSDARRKQYQAIWRMIVRYEMFKSRSDNALKVRHYTLASITAATLTDIYEYISHEDQLFVQHPEYFNEVTAGNRPPKPRSHNTMSDIFKKLRTFFKWCVSSGLIPKSPFCDFHIESELYGTPVYLTQAEMNKLFRHNFCRYLHLARQRDVFVFQCNVGCRVGDLIRLKKTDVVDGAITYIPRKTCAEHPQTVTVPLNQTARNIVSRYAGCPGDKLLPFITPQKYNTAIKLVLEKAGITRLVTVLDPLSRSDKKVRICDIGSSHMARRTFAGNIYKKVKDPALVASLTGHKEGSKAFSRYRDIDYDMKRELVELLE